MILSRSRTLLATPFARLGAWRLALQGDRLKAGTLVALALLLAANAWVGTRLKLLLEDTAVNQYDDLALRIARLPHKERVQVLVFGNSHAVYGLRPPLLARALGVPQDAVFNLAVPASTSFLMRQLLRRHLADFPNARLALCTVDVLYLADDRQICERYLTRDDLAERWRYAIDHPHDLNERLGLLAWWAWPTADLGPVLRNSLATEGRRPLERLFFGRAFHTPPRLADYPFGLPPEQDRYDGAPTRWERPWKHAIREEAQEYDRTPDAIQAGERELDSNLAALSAAGIRPVLIAPPLEGSFRHYLQTAPNSGVARQAQSLLAGYLTQAPAPVVYTTGAWSGPRTFRDADHLTRRGARRFTEQIAAALRGRGLLGPLFRPEKTL